MQSVAGAVEMTVTVRIQTPAAAAESTPEPAVAAEGRGRQYLERVAAAHRREQNVLAKAQIVRERVGQAVAPLVRAEVFAGTSAGSNVASLSHLVPRECVTAYRRAVQALRAANAALSVRVSGPWPPYSFTQLGAHE